MEKGKEAHCLDMTRRMEEGGGALSNNRLRERGRERKSEIDR